MRIMGLDVGSKTVGVAISDPLGFTAQGLEIIQINEEQGQFGFDRVKVVGWYLQGGTICSGLA